MTVTVVGSGPSGVHFALTLLRRGIPVHMVDAGAVGEPPPAPSAGFRELREVLDDPIEYFVGSDLYGLALPGTETEFYGFPPAKRFVFERPPGIDTRGDGFEPLGSWARGGLARAWTAGVYPFNDHELEAFPFGWAELEPFYAEVADRIGVTGARDDLGRFTPWHRGVGPPLDLDDGSRDLVRRYERVRDRLQRRYGCYVGRSRVAVLTASREGREGCGYLGRCLWGCPVGALYTPEHTLAECRRYDGFRYEPDTLALGFAFDEGRRIRALRTRPVAGGPERELPVETLALAAGTLSTARLFLASWREATGRSPELAGLMDNRQVLVPFVNPRRIGRPYEPRSYQYHQLSLGLASETPREYVHGQITTLTTAQAHPILAAMPVDARTAAFVFRNARAALGLVNLNFHDSRRETCNVRLESRDDGGAPALCARYRPPDDEPRRIRDALRRLRRSLRALGCVVAPGATHVRPMGASVHYAGTLPMSEESRPFTVSTEGRSHDFENLFVVDGSTFPFLPAKNITFTLMANAIRIAERAF